MKLLILGADDGYYVKQLVIAGELLGWEIAVQPFTRLCHALTNQEIQLRTCGNLLVHEFDAVLIRTMPAASLEQVIFRMDALYTLEQQGLKVLNPAKSLECAIDKWLTLTRLAQMNLPVPHTIVCETAEQAMEAFEQLGKHVVVKPIFGAEGRGMVKLDHPEIAWRTFKTLEQLQAVIYLQQYLIHPGHDLRVLVFGTEIIGAIKRYAQNDFRTNTAQAGLAEKHALTDREAMLAIAAAKATGTVFAGVDLVYDQTGNLFVLEVNGVPGWKGFQQATGINVAKVSLKFLEHWLNSST